MYRGDKRSGIWERRAGIRSAREKFETLIIHWAVMIFFTRWPAAFTFPYPCSDLHDRFFWATRSLPHAVYCAKFCFSAVCDFFVCFWIKYLGNGTTDLRQIHREDVVCPWLGPIWMSRSKVKGQGHHGQIFYQLKMHCNALAANNVIQQQTGPFRRCRGWWECTARLCAVYVCKNIFALACFLVLFVTLFYFFFWFHAVDEAMASMASLFWCLMWGGGQNYTKLIICRT